jgi:molecular chaperone GrpE (heat shock protein)
VDLTLDLQKVSEARPPLESAPPALAGWAEGVAVAARKAQAVLAQFGVSRYDAVIGSAYEPALHERVGGQPMEGMGPLRVAAQVEPGYASQQPDFVLRRAKVLISE